MFGMCVRTEWRNRDQGRLQSRKRWRGFGGSMGNHHDVVTRNEKGRLSGSRKRVKQREWWAQVKWSGCSSGPGRSPGSKDEENWREWSEARESVSQRGCRQGRLICRQQAELAETPGHRPRTWGGVNLQRIRNSCMQSLTDGSSEFRITKEFF